MSRNGRFNKTKNSLCLQAKRVVFGLKRILTKLNSPPIQVSLYLFNTNATSIAVRGELGQFPIHLFWKGSILKYGVEPTHMRYPTIYSNCLKFKERCLKMGKTAGLQE